MKIAVLITTFNRYAKTIACLERIYQLQNSNSSELTIFVADDNSGDGTPEFIAKHYPEIILLKGSGSMFWVGGMRLAWQEAVKKNYDAYLLLNDDVVLAADALDVLLQTHFYALKNFQQPGIYTGSTYDPESTRLSYGGRKLLNKISGKSILVQPDQNEPVSCDFAHANILLVRKEVVEKIGILAVEFTQRLADYDYTLRARKQGFPLLVCPGYGGSCQDDHGKNWLPANHSLKERVKYLKSPKYLAYHEYLFFMKRHFPLYRPVTFVKLWMKTIFPSIWSRFKP